MKYKDVIGIAVLVIIASVSIALPARREVASQTPAPTEGSRLAATKAAVDSGQSGILPIPIAVATAIGTYELQPQPVALVQFVDGDCCSACSQPAGDCQCQNTCDVCGASGCDGKNCGGARLRQSQLLPAGTPYSEQAPGPVKSILGVNECVSSGLGREATFEDSQMVPWEMFAWGEYIGPERTPHVPEYRLRVDDSLEFVFYQTRKQSANPYQIFVGDVIRISSATDVALDQPEITVLSDGTVSLPLIGQVRAAGKTVAGLQDELNNLYLSHLKDPQILVQVISGNTPLNDVIRAVDATQGIGGQVRRAVVSPDGTVQLPVVGSIPAVGLTLDEIRREINARYREGVAGLEVTPVLLQRAPRFIFVLGQVGAPGRFEMVGPTTVLQAIALAQGDLQGGNLRNIIIFRRDENWRLTATRLDLAGAIHGRRPFPSDELFLRDSDIVLVPRKPIQRLSESVDLYLTNTLYSIFPQNVIFDFDDFATVNP